MLKIIDVKEVKQELLEANGYTVSLRWNSVYRRQHIYWRTGVFYASLLEIGFSDADHSIEHVHLVRLSKQYVRTDVNVDFNNAELPRHKGIPVVDWTYDKPSPSRIDEIGEFYASIGETDLTLSIGENFTLKEIVVADRVSFGIDEAQHLRAIKVTGLTSLEHANIKLAILGKR